MNSKWFKGEMTNTWKSVPLKKSACVPPYAWVKGRCKQAPYHDRLPPMCSGPSYVAGNGLSAAEVEKKCKAWVRAEKKKLRQYDQALRAESGYRYHNDGDINNPRYYRSRLRNAHYRTPQRYPHGDGADLGDNYISGFSDRFHGQWPGPSNDDQVAAANKLYRAKGPAILRMFGDGHRTHRHLFASRQLQPYEAKKLEENRDNIRYLHRQDRMGRRSPLHPGVKRLLYGGSAPYLRNRYGYVGADRFPSQYQIFNQIQPQARPWRHRAHYGKAAPGVLRTRWPRYTEDRTEAFPAKTIYNQRWRKSCQDAGESKKCEWKPVLEPKWQPCEKEDCKESDPNEKARLKNKNKTIKVCSPSDPEGCSEVPIFHKPHDPIMDQILYGSEHGKEDPLGLRAELEDDHEPADQVIDDRLAGSFMTKEGGDPLGDMLVRNWQGHNGVDHYDHHHFTE